MFEVPIEECRTPKENAIRNYVNKTKAKYGYAYKDRLVYYDNLWYPIDGLVSQYVKRN